MNFQALNALGISIHHTRTEIPREEDFPLHAHNTYEIYCFLEGQGYYTVEGHDYPLSPGCLLLMRDGETHKLHISPHKPYERIALHFSPEQLHHTILAPLLAPFRDRPLGQDNMLPPCPSLTRVTDLLIRMTSPPHGDGLTPDVLQAAYLPAVLAEISTAIREGRDLPSKEGRRDNLISEIIDLINRDPAAISGVDMLESVFGYSRSYLNRVFRRSTGVSLWDYVILKRLTEARRSILNGTSAAEAASQAGFADYSSFYRQYKKRFGRTPEADKHMAIVK